MRQAWVDQRLQYENILNQRKDLKSETEMILQTVETEAICHWNIFTCVKTFWWLQSLKWTDLQRYSHPLTLSSL